MKYCHYYQAQLTRELCWLVTSTLRYSEHVAFDRCYDKEQSIFEFFVTPAYEDVFLSIMKRFQDEGIVLWCIKMENRLMQPLQTV